MKVHVHCSTMFKKKKTNPPRTQPKWWQVLQILWIFSKISMFHNSIDMVGLWLENIKNIWSGPKGLTNPKLVYFERSKHFISENIDHLLVFILTSFQYDFVSNISNFNEKNLKPQCQACFVSNINKSVQFS